MDQPTLLEELPEPTQGYRYKFGKKAGVFGGIAIVVAFAFSKPLLSSDTEWHIFTAGDPFVIPGALLKLVWWIIFGAGLASVLGTVLPAARIEVSPEGILVPNLLTRKYSSLAWNEIIEVAANRYAITISGKTTNLNIARLGVEDADWADLLTRIAQRTRITVHPI